jgi:histidinol-phosphate phosphatase family protein
MLEHMPASEIEPLDSLLYLPPRSRLGMANAVHSIRRAVFLDRDGAIVEEINYLTEPADLALLPGSVEGIKVLQEQFLIVIITNQSAVARGWLSREKLLQIHQALDSMLTRHGAFLDAILTCPHHPDDGCTCRKPAPGMLYRARDELKVCLDRSFLIGDKGSDILAGQRAGVQATIVVPSYQTAASLGDTVPDHTASDLHDAARWILKQI